MPGKIIIYGGTSGIGQATASLLSDQGYRLHLVGRSEAKVQAAAESFDAGYTVGDVTDPELFGRVAADAGEAVDGLVYAVGTINLRSIQRLKEQDFLNDLRVNAVGAALAVQAALPAMKKSSEMPSVVLYSSVAATQGFSLHASIGMAKAAVSGLTLSLAAELAPKIRVNAIAPSLTRTPLAAGVLANEQMASAIAGMHPLQRIGEPEDISSLTAFLLSSEAGWITGQVFGVDGGRSSLRTPN
jgi:NAD(P)-dependent dehydrogenase (short-subunit alcohol dehydrogenase family)